MTLLALIRKRDTGKLATAIPAISAIPASDSTGNESRIARIAKVAVANPKEATPATPAPIVGADTTAAPFDDELFQERAGILEFDAGFTREEAERRAYLEVTTWRH
jgi:hypothetical protein